MGYVESSLEANYVALMRMDPEVLSVEPQPVTLRWKYKNGRNWRYTPDFCVTFRDAKGSIEHPPRPALLVEVKPSKRLKRDWERLKPKFQYARRWAKAQGMQFKVVTERDISAAAVENQRFLSSYSPQWIDTVGLEAVQRQIALLSKLQSLGRSTPQGLVQATASDPTEQAYLIAQMWHLLYRGTIGFDLTQKLTMAAPLWYRTPMPQTQD